MFLLPQRPYVPIGTLRRAATYPDAPETRSIEQVEDAFKRVRLGHLADRLDEEGPWDQTLSGGEKQRLPFSRILLHHPDIVVLDEATAALDPASQVKLMELIADRPNTTLLSVGHRPELEAFHTRKIALERRPEGAKLVRDIDLPAEPLHRTLCDGCVGAEEDIVRKPHLGSKRCPVVVGAFCATLPLPARHGLVLSTDIDSCRYGRRGPAACAAPGRVVCGGLRGRKRALGTASCPWR
jgi:hypothetical protein